MGEFKAMYIIGENPLVSDADLNHAEASFSRLDFLVVQDIFMTETAKRQMLFLPSCCFAEKDGTFSNTERRVQRVRKAVEPPGQAWEDWRITAEIASRMGFDMNYENAEAVFTEIAKVTPSYGGITWDRIEKGRDSLAVPDSGSSWNPDSSYGNLSHRQRENFSPLITYPLRKLPTMNIRCI
jgi:formate dehydrogenase major subunit